MRRKAKRKEKKFFVYIRLFLCVGIICAALILKYISPPQLLSFVQVMNEKLRIGEAVEVISDIGKGENFIEEVGGEKEKDSEPVFGVDYYIGNEERELQEEIEQERKEWEEKEKELKLEKLSFQMSSEELYDDTKAEVFRIPPPSYCSYDKINIGFKYKAPLCGIITSKFGYRDHPVIEDASFHTGIDIAAKTGKAVCAFADGKVIEAGKNTTYGNYLLIEHQGGIRSFYGHNSRLVVKKGQKVSVGQKIAEVGSTGMSTGPHLHFEVRNGKIRLDPSLYISFEAV